MQIHEVPYVPETPWVYIFRDKKETILYIGKAKNLEKRVSQYFSPWSVRKQDMVHKAKKIEYIEATSEEEALLLEEELIKSYLPEYNRLLKYNSNYVYIRFSPEEFPQVNVVRKRSNDWAEYIGPKQRSKRLYTLMNYLRRLYKFRTMWKTKFNMWEIEMDYHLWLDAWWSLIAKLEKSKKRKEKAKKLWINVKKSKREYQTMYQENLKGLRTFLEGNTQEVEGYITQQIEKNIALENFEWCQQLKDIYEYIKSRDQKYQRIVLQNSRSWYIIFVHNYQKKHIIILLNIFEGKIIDVVRESKSKDEKTEDQLILELEHEFKVKNFKNNINQVTILASKWFSKLSTKETRELLELQQGFLESYISSHAFENDSVMWWILKNIKERYNLKELPYHIECLDISHFSWEHTSWWISCFQNGLPFKKGYRQYKIQSEWSSWSDDYASLMEVIARRFGLGKINDQHTIHYPDLFILDWWKWQLWILKQLEEEFPDFKVVQQKTEFISLGKGKARKRAWKQKGEKEIICKYWVKWDIIIKEMEYDNIDHLLIKIRDEAHRFSNRYRKKQMSKSLSVKWKQKN